MDNFHTLQNRNLPVFVPQNNRTVAPQTRTGLHGLCIVIQTENPIVTQNRAGLVQNVVQAAKTVDEQIR
jgi:hypothetical protein